MKLHQMKFELDFRKRFFTERVLRNRLPREVVTAPRLAEIKEHMDNALNGLVLGSPARSRELGTVILMGPFHLEIFCSYDSKELPTTSNLFNKKVLL